MSPFHSVNQTNARSGKQPPGKRIKHNVAFTLSARRAIAQHRYSELSSSAPLGLSFDTMTVSAESIPIYHWRAFPIARSRGAR
jgi:hypothetical protein